MPEITQIDLVGDWRVIVESRNAGWDQRVLCRNTVSGEQNVVGTPGGSLDVYGNDQAPWQLSIQHNDGQHGWQDSWLKPGAEVVAGSHITRVVQSEDVTTSDSDRDFDDLIIRIEKLGMVDQPTRPFAVSPTTIQMMPDGIFEASLGQYFMAVRVRNIWTRAWPSGSRVGLTARCRQWLAAGGISVEDGWSQNEEAVLGQTVTNGMVEIGAIAPWQSRIVYFKVDVTNAQVRKHNVEVAVLHPDAEDASHANRNAMSNLLVSRTTYDSVNKVFVSKSDRGTLTAAINELVVDYNTFKRAMGVAREVFHGEDKPAMHPVKPLARRRCDRAQLERLRQNLRRFIEGDDEVDICAVWRELQCCCTNGGFPGTGEDGEDWTTRGPTGLEFIAFPSIVDYRVEYVPGYAGQYGPIPFDDPWWKVLLIIIAILLSLAATASAAADLANRSDDVVIGQVLRSVMLDSGGTVDASVVRLNGERSLRTAIFSYLDAASGELNTTPVDTLDGIIDTTGTTMSNAQIAAAIAAFAANPTDPVARAGVRVFKSGARTGVTFGRMTAVEPLTRDDDGTTRSFINQVRIEEDPVTPNGVSNSGDSGSLWLQANSRAIVAHNHAGSRDTNRAWGSRIEDVMTQLGIRFA